MAVFSLPVVWAVVALALRCANARSSSSSSSPPLTQARQSDRCVAATFAAAIPGNASVERVDYVPQGGSYGEGSVNLGYPTNATNLPEVCAVIISVPSSASSHYRFGIFLPTEDNWNSRFLATGNGGFLGGIDWVDMGVGVKYGMATISTDTGHNSGAGDLSWALNAPEVQADWGWRAVHGSVQVAKDLVKAYYSRDISYSYWSGCSTGGRQGLKEIQISPDSFDGVLVGAPAWDTKHLMAWLTALGTWDLPASDPKSFTAVKQFNLLAATVLSQCDALDGLKDNILSNPQACKPDLTLIQCGKSGVDPLNCLRSQQIQTAMKVYNDYLTSEGELVYQGLDMGSENQWDVYQLYGNPAGFNTGWEKYFLYNNPSWQWTQYNETVIYDSERINPGDATADHFDISAYKSKGGRVIMYHGTADGLISTRSSEYYYNKTVEAVGGPIDGFFRHFVLPGMQHCANSPSTVNAPWMIGSWAQSPILGSFGDGYSVPGFKDPDHDILMALMKWVENGTAPESVIATTWNNTGSGLTVYRQRPICSFPNTAVYDGSGNSDLASSWSCT